MRFSEIFGAVAGEIRPDPVYRRDASGESRRVPGEIGLDDLGRPSGSVRVAIALPGGMGVELALVRAPLSVLESIPSGHLAHVRFAPDADALIGEFTSRRDSYDATLRISGVGAVDVLGDLSTGRPTAAAVKGGNS